MTGHLIGSWQAINKLPLCELFLYTYGVEQLGSAGMEAVGVYDHRTLRQIIRDDYGDSVYAYCRHHKIDLKHASSIEHIFSGSMSPSCFSGLVRLLATIEGSTPEMLFPRHLYRSGVPLAESLGSQVLVNKHGLIARGRNGTTVTEFLKSSGMDGPTETYLRQVCRGMRSPAASGEFVRVCESTTGFSPEVLSVHTECTKHGLQERPRLEDLSDEECPSYECLPVDEDPLHRSIALKFRRLMRDIVGMFDGNRREVLIRKVFRGQRNSQIEEELGISYSTVSSTFEQVQARINRHADLRERASEIFHLIAIQKQQRQLM